MRPGQEGERASVGGERRGGVEVATGDERGDRAAREIGGLAAALGGVDAIVFTAGIGENSPEIRRRILEASAWLGVALDVDANLAGGPMISRASGPVSAWVIPTNEELVIARHTGRLLGLADARV